MTVGSIRKHRDPTWRMWMVSRCGSCCTIFCRCLRLQTSLRPGLVRCHPIAHHTGGTSQCPSRVLFRHGMPRLDDSRASEPSRSTTSLRATIGSATPMNMCGPGETNRPIAASLPYSSLPPTWKADTKRGTLAGQPSWKAGVSVLLLA